MRILRSGRFCFVAQWFAPFVLTAVLVYGPTVIVELASGGPLPPPLVTSASDAFVIAVFFIGEGLAVVLPFVAVSVALLLVPAVVTLFDREVRATGRLRWAMSAALVVTWLATVPASIAVPRIARAAEFLPTPWRGDLIGDPVMAAIGLAGFGVMALAWTASVVLALAGAWVAERRRAVLPPPMVPRWPAA